MPHKPRPVGSALTATIWLFLPCAPRRCSPWTEATWRAPPVLNEHILAMLGGGRPVFEYLAQLDRARIWAADGNLDEALSSLPAARTALKSDHSVLFTQADELEARLRLALGDHRGALSVAERRLPDDRRMVVSAIIALGAGDPQSATEALRSAPDRGPTTRSDLELRLLRR